MRRSASPVQHNDPRNRGFARPYLAKARRRRTVPDGTGARQFVTLLSRYPTMRHHAKPVRYSALLRATNARPYEASHYQTLPWHYAAGHGVTTPKRYKTRHHGTSPRRHPTLRDGTTPYRTDAKRDRVLPCRRETLPYVIEQHRSHAGRCATLPLLSITARHETTRRHAITELNFALRSGDGSGLTSRQPWRPWPSWGRPLRLRRPRRPCASCARPWRPRARAR